VSPKTGASAAPRHAAAPASAPLATTIFNVTGLRADKRAVRALPAVATFLPAGERIDDVDWFALVGVAPLAPASRSVVFLGRSFRKPTTIRGADADVAPPSPVAAPRPPRANELVSIHVLEPRKTLRVPFYEPIDGVEDLALVAEARDDGGADLHLRERCVSPSEATREAAALDATVEKMNARGAGMVTAGLFAEVKAKAEGSEARLDIQASPEQVDAIVELVLMLTQSP
jgi:hypothetical protein